MSPWSPTAAQARAWRGWLPLLLGLALLSLCVGAQGWEPRFNAGDPVLWDIRLPRTLAVLCLGALLGHSGALAQGLFRNPLADPYLLGAGSGAALAVTAVAAAAAAGWAWGATVGQGLGWHAAFVAAAFGGALGGVGLTLALARGALDTHRLLLCGVVVGVVLGAATDLLATAVPDAWRQRQSLLLGQTQWLGPSSLAWLVGACLVAGLAGGRLARGLDGLALGDDTAASLGVPVARLRLALVALMAGSTAVAVSQAGLIAFVALVAPHVVRRWGPTAHRAWLLHSAGVGSVLLLAADVGARWLWAPLEVPVGVVTGVVGGVYLWWLLHREGQA